MRQGLLKKYGGNVPRYTSYPTAAQFQEGVGAEDYARWLSESPEEDPVSLYLHIPYCHKLCWYCACHTNITTKYEPIERYADLIRREIDLVAGKLPDKMKVSFIHWGGGSPNMLLPRDFRAIMALLRDRFTVLRGGENAMEVDPRSMTPEKVRAFAGGGITRISLGVQDFNEHVQEKINRIQPFDMTRAIVGWLRREGIKGINFDLMYGLPGQTVKDVERNVDLALELEPDRLAVFGYAHVPWMKAHQKLIKEDDLPNQKQRLKMAEAMAKRLTGHGYVRIGLDHFAKPRDTLAKAYKAGTVHRNFQGYTTDSAKTLLAFGASAIGHLPGGFVQNTTDMLDYAVAIKTGRLATVRGVPLTEDDARRWDVIEHLMCQRRVEDKTLDLFPAERQMLSPFIADGLLEKTPGGLALSKSGQPFMRQVAAVFDRYWQDKPGRHSQAV